MSTSITIDSSRCNKCGACVRECPTQAMTNQIAEVPALDAGFCMDCGHCGAVCETGAVRSSRGEFLDWRAPSVSPDVTKQLLNGRRSVRRYRKTPIPEDVLSEVLSVGPYAPTASNDQDVAATILVDDAVHCLSLLVNEYYRALLRLLENRLLWPLLWWTDLRPYLRNPSKLARVRERVLEFNHEKDWVFFGAPAVVLLTAPRKHRFFGRVNGTIAAERMMHYAAALGLGSCYIGYADVAMRRRPSIVKRLGLLQDHMPTAVFTLGYPESRYSRLPARASMPVSMKAQLQRRMV